MGQLFNLPLTYMILIPTVLLFLFVKPLRDFLNAVLNKLEQLSDQQVMILLGIVTFMVALLSVNHGNGWGDDSSQYISQTKALATGTIARWMELNQYIIDYTKFGYAPVVYPWGLSILLLPLYLLFGVNFYVFKIFEVICFVVSVLALYALFSRKLSRKATIVSILLVAFNYNILFEVDDVYADIPAMMFIVLAILCVDCWRHQNESLGKSFIIGFLMLCAIAIRTTSVAILIALFGVDLLWVIKNIKEMDFKKWITIGLPYVVCIMGMVLISVLLPSSGGEYGSFFLFDAQTITSNVLKYYQSFSQMLGDLVAVYPDNRILFYTITCLFLNFMVIGQLKHLKDELFLNIYFCLSIGVLIVFYGYSIRYMFPIFPIAILFVAYAIEDVKAKLPQWSLKALQAIFVGLLAIHLACDAYNIVGTKLGYRRTNYAFTEDALEVYEVVRNTVKEDEDIFFSKPRALLLQADVHVYGHDEKENWKNTDYVLIGPSDPINEKICSETYKNQYELVFENSEFVMYKKVKN